MPKTRFNGWRQGLNKAKQPHEIAIEELYECSDVRRRFERWERRPGFTRPFTAISDGFNVTALVDFVKRDQSANLIAGNKDGLWYLNGTTWTQRLNLASAVNDTDKWFFSEVNDRIYAVNKAAGLVYKTQNVATTNFDAVTWDTSTDSAGEDGVDILSAGVVLALNQRNWFFDVETDVDGSVPEQVRWTQANDFNRSETTDFLNLSGSHSRIKSAGVLLNQLIAAYRDDTVHLIQNTGTPVASLRATYEPGIVGPYAWTIIPGGGHFYIAKNGFFIFTGGVPQPLGRDKMTEYYLGLVNEQYYDNVHCWTDFFNEELHIGVATGSGVPSKDIVYNWAKGVWSEDNQDSWCGFYRDREQTGHIIYRGDVSGHVNQEGGTTDNGSAINPIVRLKTWSISPMNDSADTPDNIQLNHIEHDIVETSPDDASVKVATHDTGAETPSYTSYTINDVDGWMPDIAMVPKVGHYVSLQIEGFESISEVAFEWEASSTK